jgi:NADH-quinone oxidoreductase subunit J
VTTSLAVIVVGVPLVVAALLAVLSRNLVHGVLWLGAVLAGTAALFVALGAAFLATVQVLLYIGGVVTLLIFGVMLTGRPAGTAVVRQVAHRGRAALVAGVTFAALAAAVLRSDGLDGPMPAAVPTSELAGTLLGKDLLAFEALSLLLLAAMIGAIVLARPRDFTGERQAAHGPAGKGAAP